MTTWGLSDEAKREVAAMIEQGRNYEVPSSRTQRRQHFPGPAPTGVKFRNDSGYTIPRNGLLRITDYHEASKSYVVERPNDTFQRRYLVNGNAECLYTADPKTFGTGYWLDEARYIKLSASSGSLNAEWGAKNGYFEAYPNRPGFHLVKGNETIDSAYYANAIQREVTELEGKLYSGSISQGSTGSVKIWLDGADSEYAITVTARYAAIANSKWLAIGWRAGKWVAAQVEC